MKIKEVVAREILDSRGNPTVEAECVLDNGQRGRASVPSGASTGSREAHELRDGDQRRYLGLGVLKAVDNVNRIISKTLIDHQVTEQQSIDKQLCDLDGTDDKSRLGANAILAVSLSVAHAATKSLNLPLHEYLNQTFGHPIMSVPRPMMNIFNGGKHAAFSTDIQEFMIVPLKFDTFSDSLRAGSEIFHRLGDILKKSGYQTTVGDEGGYAPVLNGGNHEALDLISQAVKEAGYSLGSEIAFALDFASSEFYNNELYHLKKEGRDLSTEQMIGWVTELVRQYPIISIEDALAENDWTGWQKLTEQIGSKVQIVGDDLFVTNRRYIDKGIKEKSANAVLIKPNQIGTLSETVTAIETARTAGWKTIVSHRSGETEDTTIASLAVGLATGQIKTGSLSRTERLCKYNELLRIESSLGL